MPAIPTDTFNIGMFQPFYVDVTHLAVAPEHASLASNITIVSDSSFSSRHLATEVPVIPLPITTTSARSGSFASLPCSAIGDRGTVQYGIDPFNCGMPGECDILSSTIL